MDGREASQTALVCAKIRALHHELSTDYLFDDPVAEQLLGSTVSAGVEAGILETVGGGAEGDRESTLRTWMSENAAPSGTLARGAFAEELLLSAGSSVEQYVSIGAGFDTFGFRCPAELRHLAVFEVDHPATQDLKREHIDAAGLAPVVPVHYAGGDLELESLEIVLDRTPFDHSAPSFFAWMGVTMYLTLDAIRDTLAAVASLAAPGSHVVFDYLEPAAFDPAKADPRMTQLLSRIRELGENADRGLEPLTVGDELERAGLRLEARLSPSEIAARYFAGRIDGLGATPHHHFAHARLR